MASIKNEGKSLLLILFFTFRRMYDSFVDLIFHYFINTRLKLKIPPVKHKFMLRSAVSLSEAIRKKELSSLQVVSAYIERIKEINSSLNAVVDERFDLALEEAKKVDAFLQTTSLSTEKLAKEKPFLGVPFTSKESTAAEGMSFTFGMESRRGMKATEDAEVVRLIKAGGAILVGVTNVPELNLWCETRNRVFGQTNNPYCINCSPGGSSGGEGSIIAACGSPFGIGTDIGGSTRMPAYFCGLFGHKPTAELVSTRGLTFRTGEEPQTMVAAGSITRYAEDMTPFMKLLFDKNISKLKLDEPVDLSKLKYVYVLEPGDMTLSPVSNEVKGAIVKVVAHLQTLSSNVKEGHFKGFRYSKSLWRHGMTKESSNFAFDVGNREKEVVLRNELPKLVMGRCKHTIPVIMRLIDLNVFPKTNKQWAEELTQQLLHEIQEELGDNGVLLFPSCPTTAPYHYASFFRPYNFGYWGIFNALKLPVSQVPLGLSSQGLPLGLQIVAAPYQDHLCLAVAKELEKVFGGWVPPFQTT